MNNFLKLLVVALSIVPTNTALRAQNSVATDEVSIGPITLTEAYGDIQISPVVTTYLSIQTRTDGLAVRARVLSDLGDLQSKVGQIVDRFPLPQNNCASYGPNNLVAKIWGKQLIPSGDSAVLKLSGYVEVWACVSNPIPNSKVEWRNDGPFHLSIPHVVTWPGDPIKTILAKQPFDVSLPATLAILDDHTVALHPGTPSVSLGGQYAGITNGILNIAGVNLNNMAADALNRSIDPSKLRQSIPDDLLKLNPQISVARFVETSGKLGVELQLNSKVPADQLTDLLQLLIGRQKTTQAVSGGSGR